MSFRRRDGPAVLLSIEQAKHTAASLSRKVRDRYFWMHGANQRGCKRNVPSMVGRSLGGNLGGQPVLEEKMENASCAQSEHVALAKIDRCVALIAAFTW